MPLRRLTFFLLLFLIGCATQPPLSGGVEEVWQGDARAEGERTRVLIRIRDQDGRTEAELSLPDIGVSGWPASAVQRSRGGLVLVFPSDSGSQTMDLAGLGGSLEGSWTEVARAEPAWVSLRQVRDAARPREERLSVAGPAGAIGASLFLPPGEGPFPCVILLHGSGPEPRDANRFAAEALAQRGLAAVIFDKRGVGESGGELAGATFEDLADDAVAVARVLSARNEVAGIGFFGHSQGGWIAPLAATRWSDTAFVITSAGPAVPPTREAQWDVVRNLRAFDAGDQAEQRARAAIDLWHVGVRTSDWAAFDRDLAELRTQPWFGRSGLEAFAEHPSSAFADAYRAYMDFDPRPVLRTLQVPLMAILALEDESMDAVETEQILTAMIADGRDIRIKVYTGYDHAMRRRGAGDMSPRWPAQPGDYYDRQAEFIRQAIGRPR